MYPQAPRITVAGNNTVEVFIDPRTQPQEVDVSGMTHWGPPGRSPVNTRVVLQLSQANWHRDMLRPFVIKGRLPYVVPDGAFGVVVFGCGAKKLTCQATDARGKPTCRLTESCMPVQQAKQKLLQRIDSPLCFRPDP